MNAIATAIVPICLLLILGYIARRTQFLPDSFWQPAEKATYYVLFPLLLICLDPIDHKLYKFGKLYRARQVLCSLMTGKETIDEHS